MSKRVRVSSYRHAGGSRAHFYASRQAAAGEGTHGGFAALMVLLPLATFAAVFLWNGPPLDFAVLKGDPGPSDAELQHLYSASETELARAGRPRRRCSMAPSLISRSAREVTGPTASSTAIPSGIAARRSAFQTSTRPRSASRTARARRRSARERRGAFRICSTRARSLRGSIPRAAIRTAMAAS